jgi:cardiolipin synthase (CMP-forming)
MLDPLIDRTLVLSGVIVCWHFSLLPRWVIGVLLAREVLMLAVGPIWVKRGLELRINWPGRIAVGPTMLGVFLAMAGARAVGEGFLYFGLALAYVATALYVEDGIRQLRRRAAASTGPPPDDADTPSAQTSVD